VLTIYISIGNSDDKLTQNEWSHFYAWVAGSIDQYAHRVHGRWFSDPCGPWQNAAWCFEIVPDSVQALQGRLMQHAKNYRQDSIAWAEAQTTFIVPPPSFAGTVTT
jgi:hypothetical protein